MDFAKPHDVKHQIQSQIDSLLVRKPTAPEWQRDHEWYYQMREKSDHSLYQGDIVRLDGLSIQYDLGDSIESVPCDYGMLISNTCDMQQDETAKGSEWREEFVSVMPLQILLSPAEFITLHKQSSDEPLPKEELSKYESFFKDVRTFARTSYFYAPPIPAVIAPIRQGIQQALTDELPALYGSFSQIQGISSRILNARLRAEPDIRIVSLSDKGFYLLLLRLAAYYLRPDDRFPWLKAD